jgi:hypothetical protein
MRDRAHFLLPFVVLALCLAGCGQGGTGHRPWGATDGGVDKGEPAIAAAPGHVGSETCQGCHSGIFAEWERTFHKLSVRRTGIAGATGEGVVADADANGRDDFRDGLDLSTDPDFAALGANAPELVFNGGAEFPHRVRIGGVNYEVWRTLGGNGLWQQRYLTRIGSTVFLLPIEYVEATRDWIPYEPEVFYDGAAPRFASLGAAEAGLDPAASFDLRCAGCHSTGLEVAFDGGSGQYVTGYEEVTIGCEACHGPGAAHAAGLGDPSLILNPSDLLDGSTNGVLAADLVCGRCHVKGEGGIPPGGAHPTGYPWLTGSSTFPPGNTNLSDYYIVTNDPADWWRTKDNPMGFAPTPADPTDDTVLTARSGELTWPDLALGVHGPNNPWSPNCFDCHDPHSRAAPHQIRTEIRRDGLVFTGVTAENNKLCLVCHQGHGDFAALTATDVEGISDASAPAAVSGAVIDHMTDRAAMPMAAAAYDPAGAGAGRCVLCHQVKTAKSAAYGVDAAGHLTGDIHGHTFEVVWPNVSELTKPETGGAGITNGCSSCHPLAGSDDAAAAIAEWAVDADGDGTFHADLPRNFQNGVANPGRDGGVACVSCHTTEGFLAIQVHGTDPHALTGAGDAAARSEIVRESLRRDMGITCKACHGKGPDGTFAAGQNPLRLPKNLLCGNCHNNQTVVYDDYQTAGQLVRHPQREMLAGTAGAEVLGETYADTVHTVVMVGDCTPCHYDPTVPGSNHAFTPTVASCNVAGCHGSLGSFNRTAFADYDGDLVVEGIQDEFDGCLALLEAAILAKVPTAPDVTVTLSGSGEWLIGRGGATPVDPAAGNTWLLQPVQDGPQLRAMFNHYYVRYDASRGIHNARYALQLMQKSFEELTGSPWPGAVRN